jgi:threonine synthase
MVRYRSTKSTQALVTFREAMFRGQAPDGGLYAPDSLPMLPIDRPRGGEFAACAAVALGAWLDEEIGVDVTTTLCRQAFDFPVPLVQVGADTWVLELFHGPTAAFKDFGARFLARALTRLRPHGRRLTVLVATSGDTGSAVAHAFDGLRDVHVVVLYPANKVSPLQEAQLKSGPHNTHALRIEGDFDDCQRLVKDSSRLAGCAAPRRRPMRCTSWCRPETWAISWPVSWREPAAHRSVASSLRRTATTCSRSFSKRVCCVLDRRWPPRATPWM